MDKLGPDPTHNLTRTGPALIIVCPVGLRYSLLGKSVDIYSRVATIEVDTVSRHAKPSSLMSESRFWKSGLPAVV